MHPPKGGIPILDFDFPIANLLHGFPMWVCPDISPAQLALQRFADHAIRMIAYTATKNELRTMATIIQNVQFLLYSFPFTKSVIFGFSGF